MAAGLQDHRSERERPYVVAVAGGAEGEARVVRVLLGPVKRGVQPGAHRRVLQRVAGELPVGAVEDEREEQQQPCGDVAAAAAGGRAARRDQRGEQGGGGDLVRGEAAACAPAREVARVRADEVRGEEPVTGLHRAPQPYRLVVDRRHGGLRGGAGGLVDGDGGDERAELGALHDGALGLQRDGEAAGHGAVGDGHGVRVAGRPHGDAGAHRRSGAAQGPDERRACLRLHGERTGDGGGRESRVGQSEPEGVDVPDEAGVDEGDADVGGSRGEQLRGFGDISGGLYVEAQRPQIVRERRSGYRRTGEDGGRQTNSLLGADGVGARQRGPDAGRRHVGRGYRMNGSGNSSPVCAPFGVDRQHAMPPAIIIVDARLGPQTAVAVVPAPDYGPQWYRPGPRA